MFGTSGHGTSCCCMIRFVIVIVDRSQEACLLESGDCEFFFCFVRAILFSNKTNNVNNQERHMGSHSSSEDRLYDDKD